MWNYEICVHLYTFASGSKSQTLSLISHSILVSHSLIFRHNIARSTANEASHILNFFHVLTKILPSPPLPLSPTHLPPFPLLPSSLHLPLPHIAAGLLSKNLRLFSTANTNICVGNCVQTTVFVRQVLVSLACCLYVNQIFIYLVACNLILLSSSE